MTDKTLKNMLDAVQHYAEKRYVSAESCLSIAQDTVNRLAYNYRLSEPQIRGLCPNCGYRLHELRNKEGVFACSHCDFMFFNDGSPTDYIYLGLYGTYPIDETDEDQLMARKASEGTKKISDLMDRFIIELLTLQEEYSNEGACDTSARENIFEKLGNRYYNTRIDGF